jgi:hypothetical protein
LLIKVADRVASSLAASIVLEAIKEAVSLLCECEESEEENSSAFQSTVEQHPSAPRFGTNMEVYTVDVGDNARLVVDFTGHPIPFIAWYFGETPIEMSK